MRILQCLCAMIALSTCAAHAQSLNDVINPAQRHHDFGAVPRAGKFEHRFEIHNPYQVPMQLQGVRTSCGCTTPTLPETVVQPGQSVPLITKFNSDNLQLNGQKKATVTLTISSPISAELQFTVAGYIRTDIVVTPVEAAFGSMAEGIPKKLELAVNYAGRSDWQIVKLSSPFSFVKADFQEVERQGNHVKYLIHVGIEGDAPDGYLENLLVAHTNDRRLTSFPIRVTATVEKPLEFSPANVALKEIKPNESIEQLLVIKWKGKFQIKDITSDIAEIRFNRPIESKNAFALNLKIAPRLADDASSHHLNGNILIHTDISDQPFKIPMGVVFETEKLVEAK